MKLRHKHSALFLTSFLMLGVITQVQGAPQPLRVAVAYAPKTLDPATATDAAAARLLQLTHPALLKWNEHYEPTGQVASACTQPSPVRVECTLPAGKTFTSGAPLTAPALQGWFRALQGNPQSPFSGALKGVSITAPKAETLAFALPSPTLTFLPMLTEIPLADPSNTQHGAGPYHVVQKDAVGNTTLATDAPQLPPSLTFVYVADATTRMLKLKKGEVDVVMNDLAPELVQWARQQGFPTVTTPGTSYSYLGVNFNNPRLADAPVREALTLGFNRPAIRKYLLGGMAEAASSLLPPGHPAMWAAPEEPFDPFTAEGLLEDSGYMPGLDATRLTFTLLTSTDAFSQRVAQALQAQAQKIGIRLELRPTEWAAFYDAVKKGQFDLVLLTWTGEQQPDFYYQLFHSSQVPPSGFNRGNLNNTTVDALTQTIHTATSQEAQTEATRALQKKLAELRPYIPLYRRHHVLVTAKTVTGCQLPPSGAYTGLLTCQKTPDSKK